MLLESLFRYLDFHGTRSRAKCRRQTGRRGLRRSRPLALENLEDRTVLSPAAYFEVIPFVNSVPAGLPSVLTVQARDTNNMPDQAYVGSVHFTSSDGAATLPDDYTFTPADQGKHTFPVTLFAAGRQTVTVTDTDQSNLTGTTASINEFPLHIATSSPWGITRGPSNALWFTETSAGGIGKVTLDGVVIEIPVGPPPQWPQGDHDRPQQQPLVHVRDIEQDRTA